MQSQRLNAKASQFITDHILWILGLAILLIIAYGYTAFNFTVAGDEWEFLQLERGQHDFILRMGRWIVRVAWELGAYAAPAPAFTITFYVCGLVIGAWLQYKTVDPKSIVAFFVSAAVFALSPFWAEFVGYDPEHVALGVGIVAASGFGYTAKQASLLFWSEPRNRFRAVYWLLLSIVLFVIAAGANQSYIFVGVIAYLAWIAYGVILSDSMTIKAVVWHLLTLAVAVVLSLVAYFLLVRGILLALNITPLPPDHHYNMTGALVRSIDDLLFTLNRFARFINQFLFQPSIFFPVIAKYLFLAIVGAYLGLAAYLLYRRKELRVPGKILRFVVLVIVLLLIFIIPWSIGIIRTTNPYRLNGLAGLASVYSCLFLLGIGLAQVAKWRRLLMGVVGVGFVIAAIFAFQHNMAAVITQINNNRDASIATRILYQLETQPNYADLVAFGEEVDITIIGQPSQQTGRPFDPPDVPGPMVWARPECGVFDCQPQRVRALLHLYQYGTINYRLNPGGPARWNTRVDIPAALVDIVDNMTVFPLDGSVLITDDLSRILIKFEEVDSLE